MAEIVHKSFWNEEDGFKYALEHDLDYRWHNSYLDGEFLGYTFAFFPRGTEVEYNAATGLYFERRQNGGNENDRRVKKS